MPALRSAGRTRTTPAAPAGVKFLLDQNQSPLLVELLTAYGHDVATSLGGAIVDFDADHVRVRQLPMQRR